MPNRFEIKYGMKKILFLFLICCMPLVFCGCGSALEQESKNLSAYKIDVVYDQEAQELCATEDVRYKNNSQSVLEEVKFHLYPNAFRENAKASVVSLSSQASAYPNGKSYGSINIEGVGVSGDVCNFEIGGEDENILRVPLFEKLFPGECVDIKIDFGVALPNINHRFGYGENAVNLANFYPVACAMRDGEFCEDLYHYNGDPFFSEMANYEITLECDGEFVVASSGEETSNQCSDGKRKYVASAKCVRDFAMVLSKRFEVLSATQNGCEVKYFYYDDQFAKENLQVACDALATFEEIIGDYPYPTLCVAKTNFVHGGMEYPNIVYISDDVSPNSTYQEVIVHEIAHQWWYNVVGNNAFENSWLDEGLTEYCTALFYEENPKYNVSFDEMIKNAQNNWNTFEKVYKSVYKDFKPNLCKAIDEYTTEYEYTYCTYVRGMLMFDSLRGFVGKSKFEKCIKNYYKQNMFKIVTPETLMGSFEKTCKTDLENFFRSWLEGDVVTMGAIG